MNTFFGDFHILDRYHAKVMLRRSSFDLTSNFSCREFID